MVHQNRAGKKESRIHLHLTPISVAKVLETALWQRMEGRGSVVLISATLSNSGGFSFLRKRLGVPEQAIECVEGSPFDYKEQALLYVPGHLPPPAPDPEYAEKMVKEIEKVLLLKIGRAHV